MKVWDLISEKEMFLTGISFSFAAEIAAAEMEKWRKNYFQNREIIIVPDKNSFNFDGK